MKLTAFRGSGKASLYVWLKRWDGREFKLNVDQFYFITGIRLEPGEEAKIEISFKEIH